MLLVVALRVVGVARLSSVICGSTASAVWAGSRGVDADVLLGIGVSAGVGRCAPPGMIGTHSRGGGTFCCSVWASETETGSDSGPVPTSMGSWDSDTAAVVARSFLPLRAEKDDDGAVLGVSFCHFSRAWRRFGVFGPRADSGEKPSKASQAVAKCGNRFSFGRDAEMGRLRLKTSPTPRPVPSIPCARGEVMERGDHQFRSCEGEWQK